MGFTFDVFLSYARLDDQEGRVAEFVEDLKNSLTELLGRPATIAFDKTFSPSEEFEPAIAAKIKDSALMVALTSRSQIKSNYCKSEIKSFCSKAALEPGGLSIDNRRRLVNGLLFDLPYTQWHAELRGANPHKFFTLTDGIPRPLRRGDAMYLRAIERLAFDLSGLLELIEQETKSAPGAVSPLPPQRDQSIFVARAPSDEVLRFHRVVNELRRVLTDLPVRVVTADDYSEGFGERQKWTAQEIARATVTVHLLSTVDQTGVRESLQLGLQAPARQVLWTGFSPGGADRRTPYDDLIDSARRDTSGLPQGKVIEEITTAPSEAATTIASRIREWIEASLVPGELTVCIDMSPADLADADADEFFEYLKTCGISPRGSTNDPGDFDTQLPRSRAVVVFYGNVEDDWVAKRFNGALRVITTQELSRAPSAWGVYYAKPKNDRKPQRLWTRGLTVPIDLLEMNGMDGFSKAVVAPLLAKLGVRPPDSGANNSQ